MILISLFTVFDRSALAKSARPNILFAIADDQSFPHASAYGSGFVKTPAFDRVAREGLLFTQAFCPAPGCSPSRASILTGRNIWQNREAGTHASNFPSDLKVFTRALEEEAEYRGLHWKGLGTRQSYDHGLVREPRWQSLQSPQHGVSQGYQRQGLCA